MTLHVERHSQTLARHSWPSSDRCSYTPIARWWSLFMRTGAWCKCMSWPLD